MVPCLGWCTTGGPGERAFFLSAFLAISLCFSNQSGLHTPQTAEVTLEVYWAPERTVLFVGTNRMTRYQDDWSADAHRRPSTWFHCWPEHLRSLRWMAGALDMMYGPLFSIGLTTPSGTLGLVPPWGIRDGSMSEEASGVSKEKPRNPRVFTNQCVCFSINFIPTFFLKAEAFRRLKELTSQITCTHGCFRCGCDVNKVPSFRGETIDFSCFFSVIRVVPTSYLSQSKSTASPRCYPSQLKNSNPQSGPFAGLLDTIYLSPT